MSQGLLLPEHLLLDRHQAICEVQVEEAQVSEENQSVFESSRDMSGLISTDII